MKICFVVFNAYPVVEPNAPGFFGGSETRAVTLARGLAKSTEHEICFIVQNPELKQPRLIDAVMYIPWCDFWAETREHVAEHLDLSVLPRIRFKRWSWKLLWEIPLLILSNPWRRKHRDPRRKSQIFQQINADLYCGFGINPITVQTVYNAKILNQSSLLFLGHDMDLDERHHPESDYISPAGERAETSYWVLKNADRIIAQTESQQQLLKQRFDRKSMVLLNPFDLEHWKNQASRGSLINPWGDEKYVLWIGRADAFHKLPARFVELAKKCPSLKFLMIMNPSDPVVEQQIKQNRPENLKVIDTVPHCEMPGVFRDALAFVNTSTQEGFPNVFLQAIASEVPIISYEVGKEFLGNSRAGVCVQGNVNDASQLLIDHSLKAQTDSQFAFQFLTDNYLCASICAQLDELILEPKQSA